MQRLRDALCSPLLLPLALTDQRELIDADVRRWNEILGNRGMLCLLRMREFRNLYLYRLSNAGKPAWLLGRLLMCVYRIEPTLRLSVGSIGPGLFIQHGFATIVVAERIGANCWINQQVTIGFKDRTRCPVLDDEVVVHAGAKVIGDLTIGHGTTVGANAVVIKDVPPRHTAVGVPARYIPKRELTAELDSAATS
jgi:serine O-acetyltransferase